MAFVKRIFLYLVVNALVVLSISIILNLFGVRPYLTNQGIDFNSLMIFCLVWGMVGSLISLFMSRAIAKWTMKIQLLDPQTTNPSERRLVDIIHELCRKANISTMPEVGIYDSQEINAFATGPSKSMALVAVSSGLLNAMDGAEVEGVLGHEITHIANGDMVTMALLQGIINSFVMFLSRAIAYMLTQSRDDRERSYFMYWLIQFILEMVFLIFGSLAVAAFSRWREYRADAGGAQLAGRDKMIAALVELQKTTELAHVGAADKGIQALKISGGASGFMTLFSSHPPLTDRIKRLQEMS